MIAMRVQSRLLLVAIVGLAFLSLVSGNAFAAGSFAYGQGDNGSWSGGSSYNYKTQAEADAAALRTCNDNQNGIECEIIARPSNTCFAIAVVTSDNGYSSSFSNDRTAAVNDAMIRCSKMGACTPQDSFCDGTAHNPDDEGKPWSIIKKYMYRICGDMGQCYQNCRGHPLNLGRNHYQACLAVCSAKFKECYAFHRRDEPAYRRASSELDDAFKRRSEATDYTPPPQQDDDSSSGSGDRGEGYGGFR